MERKKQTVFGNAVNGGFERSIYVRILFTQIVEGLYSSAAANTNAEFLGETHPMIRFIEPL